MWNSKENITQKLAFEFLNCKTRNPKISKDSIQDEIINNLKDMKNHNPPGGNEFNTENIKMGGTELPNLLCKLYNAYQGNSITLDQWNKVIKMLLHKKGDIAQTQNYRPIILRSHIYKLFMTIISYVRLTSKLDLYSLTEQTEFRKDYGINDYLTTMKIFIEKCIRV